MRHKLFLPILLALACLLSCNDDETFTTSSSARLTFSTDTLRLDTIFSGMASATQSLWAWNHNDDGVRINSVTLTNGASSGFRANVDGVYLAASSGYSATDLELRHRDSLRVFIELTAPTQNATEPQLVSDDLVFRLESGVEQSVNLQGYAWDALLLDNLTVDGDYTLDGGGMPILVRGTITVDSAATLTIAAGQTLYFEQTAGIDVHGTLLCNGTADAPVTLRGSRLDHMFDYLPYDRVPGQWQGIHLYSSSLGNLLSYTDLHSAYNGIVADSCDTTRQKLHLFASTIHNCQGKGLWAVHSNILVENSQLTNTLDECLRVDDGVAQVNGCTLAQFYPYDSNRGAALSFSAATDGVTLSMANSLVTGYADDQVMGYAAEDSAVTFSYAFDHCLLRTPEVTGEDSVYFASCLFEDIEDTTSTGRKHFRTIDIDNLYYDFHLATQSSAIGVADTATLPPTDRDGNARREEQPAAGAFEWTEE